jgi:hypothetical protein
MAYRGSIGRTMLIAVTYTRLVDLGLKLMKTAKRFELLMRSCQEPTS